MKCDTRLRRSYTLEPASLRGFLYGSSSGGAETVSGVGNAPLRAIPHLDRIINRPTEHATRSAATPSVSMADAAVYFMGSMAKAPAGPTKLHASTGMGFMHIPG